jgi:hypothetical protein
MRNNSWVQGAGVHGVEKHKTRQRIEGLLRFARNDGAAYLILI